MADPLDALRQPVVPVQPRPEFAAALRRRLQTELEPPPRGGATMTTPTEVRPSYVPARLHSVVPYLCARDAARAIEFYRDVLGATEESPPVVMPDGTIGHAELRIGDTVFMIADEWPAEDIRSPLSLGGTCVQLTVYVEDCDAVFARAVAAGAHVWRPVTEAYGDRVGKIRDPFGHNWMIATHIQPAATDR
jgi:uncharacterized glyoxalase superfamily protein PhnB